MSSSHPQDMATPASHLSSLNQAPPLVVDLLAVQNIAHDFQLSETQTDMLKTFVKLGSAGQGLSKPNLLTRLFHLALTIHYENQWPKDDQNDVQTLRGIVKDLKVWLENTFSLTSDQIKNIRALAFDKVYDPLCTCYMAINADLFDYIKSHAEELHFGNVFGNPVYEQVVEQAIRKTCSSVRNGFRQHLQDSIKNGISAAVFTHHMNALYLQPGGPKPNDQLILLRNIALHSDLLWEEEKDGNNVDEGGPEGSKPPAKRKKSSNGKKPKGHDFWSMVDEWYSDKMKTLGTKVTNSGWKQLLEEFVSFDEGGFVGPSPDFGTVSQANFERQQSSVFGSTKPSFP
ncbi:hypothetical protein BDP27DRAFT_1418126 [Rhodocollybia butyracea]|uniref:Uncharacterized protein n=1 Tax=Rhodocollybia butyracea TaxID=206335 RepID=A0A9P5UAX9_9AGAR|nr:hypothetical protein BDP27DRAFT_1418126 [Rhodocollybia butyracea]